MNMLLLSRIHGDSKKGTGASGLKFSFYFLAAGLCFLLFFYLSFYLSDSSFPHTNFLFLFLGILGVFLMLARNEQKKEVKGRADNEVMHTHHLRSCV